MPGTSSLVMFAECNGHGEPQMHGGETNPDPSIGTFRAFLVHSCRILIPSIIHFCPDMKCSKCRNLTFYGSHVASQWGVAPRSFAVGRCLVGGFFSKIRIFGLDVKGYEKNLMAKRPRLQYWHISWLSGPFLPHFDVLTYTFFHDANHFE